MDYISTASRIVLPLITLVLLLKCILTLWLGHPKEKIYGYIVDMLTGQRYALNMWETSIGRTDNCDIKLEYDSIARSHAVITRRIDGWYVYDLLSRPDTKVNGKFIEKKQTINNGDILTFGKTRFRFEVIDDPVLRAGKDKKKHRQKSAAAQSPARNGATPRPNTAQPPVQPGAPAAAKRRVKRVCCIVNKQTRETFALFGNEVRIGTSPRCDIRLQSQKVAKLHAAIVLYEDGWAIENRGAGVTLLNGERVNSPLLLYDGDIITLGDVRLYYTVKTTTAQ